MRKLLNGCGLGLTEAGQGSVDRQKSYPLGVFDSHTQICMCVFVTPDKGTFTDLPIQHAPISLKVKGLTLDRHVKAIPIHTDLPIPHSYRPF